MEDSASTRKHVIDNRKAPPDILEDEARASIQKRSATSISDALARCVRDRGGSTRWMKPLGREAIAENYLAYELTEAMKDLRAIAIAGAGTSPRS